MSSRGHARQLIHLCSVPRVQNLFGMQQKQKALADANGVLPSAAVKTVAVADASLNDGGSLLGGSAKVLLEYSSLEV